MAVRRHKEAIHSGQFMVSEFEAEAQDEEDLNVASAISKEESGLLSPLTDPQVARSCSPVIAPDSSPASRSMYVGGLTLSKEMMSSMTSAVAMWQQKSPCNITDISLNKLFQSMNIAYRQKLTSPKWNRFRGLKLRWKDKIRLNNVIWRCWHLQFIKGHRRLLCAFANPLDIDHHHRTEGGTVLEGKYWKRKLDTIKKEYQRWRKFYIHSAESTEAQGQESDGEGHLFMVDNSGNDLEQLFLRSPFQGSKDDGELEAMLNDEGLMLDILLNAASSTASDTWATANFSAAFSQSGQQQQVGTSNYSFGVSLPLPNARDVYKNTTNADFIQPGLGPLQPNLDEMNFDYYEFSDIFNPRPPNPDLAIAVPPCEPIPDKAKLAEANNPTMPPAAPMVAMQIDDPAYQFGPMTKEAVSMMSSAFPPPPPQPSHYYLNQRSSHQHKMRSPKHRAVHQQLALQPQPYKVSPGQAAGSAAMSVTDGDKGCDSELRQLLKKKEPAVCAKTSSLPCSLAAGWCIPPPRSSDVPQSVAATFTHGSSSSGRDDSLHSGLMSSGGALSQCSSSYFCTSGGMDGSRGKHSFRGLTHTSQYQEHRRSAHINAEQNRRHSIKNGFETLRALIHPSLASSGTSCSMKTSKAALLMKGGDFLVQLKAERNKLSEQSIQLRRQIDCLNSDVSELMSMLPTNGAVGIRSCKRKRKLRLLQAKGQDTSQDEPLLDDNMDDDVNDEHNDEDKLMRLFEQHVKSCTNINWKYWVFSQWIQPLLPLFLNAVVGAHNFDELVRACLSWTGTHMAQIQLRQNAVSSMRHLSLHTSVLSHPQRLPYESLAAVSSWPRRTSSPRQPSATATFKTDTLI